MFLLLAACDSSGGITEEEKPSAIEELKEEVWPQLPATDQYQDIVAAAREAYRPDDHIRWISDGYSPTGQYLNYWHQIWGNTETIRFDEEGVPQTKYGDTIYNHPVTLCRYAFHLHGRIVRGAPELTETFFKVVERLLSLQDERGSFLYPFAYRLYGTSSRRGGHPAWRKAWA